MRLPVLPPIPKPSHFVQKLPQFILQPLSHSPFSLQRMALERVLKQVFKEAIAEGDFNFLENKYLRVDIRDLKLCWYFSFDGQQITVHRYARPDATISGELHEFLLLMSRREDPDTLFFQRRLQISGDTKLGLEVKNLLDTIDMDTLPYPIKITMDKIIGFAV
ncbi:MAG: SCP2 sterol-binding domain-containing protein [Gammaproteobacteria bacterium]|nr:SCP2 sterol-binding domain-containing protein [Gammaproteobacteria bacterium]